MTETERKMQLTRFIRQENAMNRMKVKNRENILYGNGKTQLGKDDLPLVYEGYPGEEEFSPQQSAAFSTFGLRILLAVLLFAAVVYLDRNGINWGGELAAQVIARQVAASDEEKLIDFVNNVTYSLSGKEK